MAYKKLKYWFDAELAEQLGNKIKAHKRDFRVKPFAKSIAAQLEPLELKARIECFADAFHEHLALDYPQAVEVLSKILGPENEEETGMFTLYHWLLPFGKYAEKYGIEHFEISMSFIEEITKRSTGEYCIRPFIERYPKKSMQQLKRWSKHKNKHVRRLASEGCRPRLPWSRKLEVFIESPQKMFPILEQLKDDPSKYVQKSVANSMNDVIKDNRSIALDLLRSWAKNAGKERQWIIKHALRNLRKKGEPEAAEIIALFP